MRRQTTLATITILLPAAAITRAADVVSQWSSPGGNWSDAGNWINSPPAAAYPNNSGGVTYDASVASGSATLSEAITIESLSLAGGQISNSGFALQVNQTLDFTAGTFAGAVAGVINVAGHLNFSGAGGKTISQTLRNAGTATWTGTGVFGTGTLENLPGATFDCQNNGTGQMTAMGVVNFINRGTLIKTAGTQTRFGGVETFDNQGTVQVNAGLSLQWNGSIAQFNPASHTLAGGTWIVAGGEMVFPGGGTISTNQGNITLDGAASLFNAINALSDNQGTLTFSGGRSFSTGAGMTNSGAVNVAAGSVFTSAGPLNWTGGSMGGAGTVIASAGVSISGIVTKPGAGVLVVAGDLSLALGSRLDLTQGKMIFHSVAVIDATALIASGRGTGNRWDGATGIVTSQSAAVGSNYTSLGVARAADVRPGTATATDLWAGQAITGTDTLVMYTYGGDANLDGKLNVDDYIKIDSGIAAGLTGWSNGDFNYDGKVNIDDYTTVIDANIGNQSGAFPTASSVTAVPEPSVFVSGAMLLLATLRRRRRISS